MCQLQLKETGMPRNMQVSVALVLRFFHEFIRCSVHDWWMKTAIHQLRTWVRNRFEPWSDYPLP
jgi:hypothetical protein